MPGTRKLGRTADHRTAMLRAMVTFLLENGKIETTVTRAKEVSAMTEKYITLAKDNSLASKRQAFSFITKESVVKKLYDEYFGEPNSHKAHEILHTHYVKRGVYNK